MKIITLGLALLISSTGFAADIYIAVGGNDTNPGSLELPLATLVGARQAVRTLKARGPLTEPVRIHVADGWYELTEPLVLGPEDSGSAAAPIIYQAAVGAQPVFSGGRKIDGWRQAENGLWTTQLPQVADGDWYFEQLFVNGRRATRVRTPNKFYFYIQDVQEEKLDAATSGGAQARQTVRMRPEDYNVLKDLTPEQLADVNLHVFHNWDNTRRFIERLEPQQDALLTVGEALKPWNPWKRNSHYQLENFHSALDAPGEWFLDRAGTLSYMPLAGEQLEDLQVVAPVIDYFLKLEGNAARDQYVEHVQLRGLTFRHAQWLTPPEGFEAAQAAAPIDAVLMCDGARHVTIEDCEVGHIGRYAVWFRKGCHDCTLRHCHLFDFGAGGVRIGETRVATEPAERTDHITVDNNIVRQGGAIFPSAVGVWIGQSGDNNITHNEIADLYYTGISVGWTWGYGTSLAKRNTIAFNHVHHLGWGLLSDMGGIYTLGPSEGTVVLNNVFHDIYAYSYGGWGLYTDEGSTGVLFENNLVYRVKTGGFHQHYGKENIIRNNVLAYSKLHQLQATRAEEHRSFTFENNIVYWDEGPLLSGAWDNLNFISRNNCYWKTGSGAIDFAGKSLEAWQALGHEQGSVIADPHFANPQQEDFGVPAKSPAVQLGFQSFRPAEAGVYGDPNWIAKARNTQYPDLEPAPEPPSIIEAVP